MVDGTSTEVISFQAYFLYLRFRLIKKECINVIVKKTKMGDFFLLYMMGLNIDSVIFKEVVQELARKLGYHNKDIYESWSLLELSPLAS